MLIIILVFVYLFGVGIVSYITDELKIKDSFCESLYIAFWPIIWIPLLGYYIGKYIHSIIKKIK